MVSHPPGARVQTVQPVQKQLVPEASSLGSAQRLAEYGQGRKRARCWPAS